MVLELSARHDILDSLLVVRCSSLGFVRCSSSEFVRCSSSDFVRCSSLVLERSLSERLEMNVELSVGFLEDAECSPGHLSLVHIVGFLEDAECSPDHLSLEYVYPHPLRRRHLQRTRLIQSLPCFVLRPWTPTSLQVWHLKRCPMNRKEKATCRHNFIK